MSRFFVFVFFAVSLLLLGCVGQTQYKYVCPDGRTVGSPQECSAASAASASASKQGEPIVLVPEPTLGATAAPSITPPSSVELEGLEKQILEDINVARQLHGLEPLVWNERAASAARKYSKALVVEQRFAHVGSDSSNIHDRLNAEGLVHFISNENLAQVSFNGTLPESNTVVDGWLKSPGHRSNIIDEDRLYSHAGVGVYCGSEVCVAAYTAVSLRRSAPYSLDRNFYSFVYMNDPGYDFGRTVPMRIAVANVSGLIDAYVLLDYKTFEALKEMDSAGVAARRFPRVKAFESTQGFSDGFNASVGMGLMVMNKAEGVSRFVVVIELLN